jgi:hypothetical protein
MPTRYGPRQSSTVSVHTCSQGQQQQLRGTGSKAAPLRAELRGHTWRCWLTACAYDILPLQARGAAVQDHICRYLTSAGGAGRAVLLLQAVQRGGGSGAARQAPRGRVAHHRRQSLLPLPAGACSLQAAATACCSSSRAVVAAEVMPLGGILSRTGHQASEVFPALLWLHPECVTPVNVAELRIVLPCRRSRRASSTARARTRTGCLGSAGPAAPPPPLAAPSRWWDASSAPPFCSPNPA